jgi:glycosyltransferase involved in cell wall biosynthesis
MSPPPESKTILFVGSYRWPPNRDGVTRFVQHILPRIRQQVPTATLRFVGEDSQLLDGIDGVSGAGFVEDLVAEYRNAALVVCPIYSGAGANVKLAEAALFGKAIVATSHAARGFEGMLEPERDLLVADTDETITAACIRLLQDEHVRTELERNSLRAAAEHLSQPAIDRIVGNALERCW